MKYARIFSAGLLAAGPSFAQQSVFIVDDDGGPGVHFTSLQEALDAAAPGDRIEVNDGTYAPSSASLGVTVMAAGNDVVLAGLIVVGLPAGEIFVLTDPSRIGAPAPMQILDCEGTVILDGIGRMDRLGIERSADVRISGMAERGHVTISDSFVQLTSCSLGTTIATRSEVVISDSLCVGIVGERDAGKRNLVSAILDSSQATRRAHLRPDDADSFRRANRAIEFRDAGSPLTAGAVARRAAKGPLDLACRREPRSGLGAREPTTLAVLPLDRMI